MGGASRIATERGWRYNNSFSGLWLRLAAFEFVGSALWPFEFLKQEALFISLRPNFEGLSVRP